jgi:ParB family chromosome partitioning protein
LRLPDDIQDKVATGDVSARSAYELSRLENEASRDNLARGAAAGMTAEDTARAVRQRRGKTKLAPKGTKQTFVTEDGWKVMVSAARKGMYDDVERALAYALEDVRHRINAGRVLF